MKQFELEISSLNGILYKGKCESLRIPTEDGYYGIQAGFNPSIISMTKGKTFITTDNNKIEMQLNDGIVITDVNKTTILID